MVFSFTRCSLISSKNQFFSITQLPANRKFFVLFFSNIRPWEKPEHNYLELGYGFRQRVFKSLALTLESFLSLGNSFNLVLSSDDSTYLTCFLRGLLR